MLCDVETFALSLFDHAQADGPVDQLKQHERHDAGPNECYADGPELTDHLTDPFERAYRIRRVVVDTGAAERRVHEHARENRTDDAADTVNAKGIERVVITELGLEP